MRPVFQGRNGLFCDLGMRHKIGRRVKAWSRLAYRPGPASKIIGQRINMSGAEVAARGCIVLRVKPRTGTLKLMTGKNKEVAQRLGGLAQAIARSIPTRVEQRMRPQSKSRAAGQIMD